MSSNKGKVMKVKRVIVDEIPRFCDDCLMEDDCFCYGMQDLVPASCNKPDNCPLELEDVITVEQIENAWKQGHNL